MATPQTTNTAREIQDILRERHRKEQARALREGLIEFIESMIFFLLFFGSLLVIFIGGGQR